MAFAFFSRKNDRTFAAQTLSLLGLICLGFAIFILFYSNPFGRAFPAPVEGRDLNPMLQDIGLISIHHFYTSAMWALPLTSLCRFQP